MASIKEMREALARAIADNVSGLQAHAKVPPQFQTPAAFIEVDRIHYHTSGEVEDAEYVFRVTLLASTAVAEQAQDQIDVYIDPQGGGSIRAAIEADPTLDGVVDDATVTDTRDVGHLTHKDIEYYAASVMVEVRT